MGSVGQQRAKRLVDEGFPLNIAMHAVPQYVERSRAAIAELDTLDSLIGLKLLTGQLIAEEHRDPVRAAQLFTQVHAIAERLGTDLARAHSLLAWATTHPTPEYSQERINVSREVLAIADEHPDADLQTAAYLILLVALLESGDIRSLDVQLLEERARRASSDGTGAGPTAWMRCLRTILDGDIALAESHVEALLATQIENSGDDVTATTTESLALYITQLGMIRWMQGRIDRAEDLFLRARRVYPEQLIWPVSLAWLWLLQGRTAAGEALLRTIPAPEDIPRDRYWLSTITVLAEISIIHGSRERAEQLRELLTPFADRLVPVGVGAAFWGTSARTLGLLEERLGMRDRARQHLELAIVMSERIGALAWHAEAQIELALFALRHDLTDIAAYELLAEARATSLSRGFALLAHRAMAQPRIRVLGQFEVTSVCGVRAVWNSRKARELLKMLVAARGVPTSREVFMHVLWPDEAPAKLGNRFSVAVNVIRRAFDPGRMHPTQHLLITEGDSVRLEIARIDIDLERFLAQARRDGPAAKQFARTLYRGDAFAEEPYADWAVAVRDEARNVWQGLQMTDPVWV